MLALVERMCPSTASGCWRAAISAAAHAEAGEFAAAVERLSEALALLKADPVRKGFAVRLDLYKAHQPYREEPKRH